MAGAHVAPAIPLSGVADGLIRRLATTTQAPALAALDGATLLGERAMLGGFRVPGRVSAGGGCRLLAARNGAVALNLARPADRDLLPALFADDALDPADDAAIAAHVASTDAEALVARGRLMGLAIAGVDERHATPPAPVTRLTHGPAAAARDGRRPRVLDLSALWAGPLAAHLLWLAGAVVTKVESRTRPDAMRGGDPAFHALLDQGKASVMLDFADPDGRRALLALIAASDIVIEAARPRALRQLGVDAAAIVRAAPGLVWLTITAHGATGDAADWVGFGDDVGVAAGLTAALRDAGGGIGFVGDAIADPLTGLHAAAAGWRAWAAGAGGRYGIAMRDVAAHALAEAHRDDPAALARDLAGWGAARGRPFPIAPRRATATVAPLGADTARCLAALGPC